MVIERLVIGIIKTKPAQFRLQAPVSLGQKQEVRMRLADPGNGRRPKLLNGGGSCDGKMFPGFGENPVEHQHRHIAANTVAVPGDGGEQFRHRTACRIAPIVQLNSIRPRREIRILAIGQPANLPARLLRERASRLPGALHKQLRLLPDPGMVQPKMVGHEIQHQFHALRMKLPPKCREPRLATQRGWDLVIANRVR